MAVYLDTHVVVWLHAGEPERLNPAGIQLIESEDCLISPLVLLELQYLREIKRVRYSPEKIRDDLEGDIGLRVCTTELIRVVSQGIQESWTRDPFDRMIVAHAKVGSFPLLSKDPGIRENYDRAVW